MGSNLTGVLMQRGNLDIEMHIGRTPCKDEGRDGDDASTCQGMLKNCQQTTRS